MEEPVKDKPIETSPEQPVSANPVTTPYPALRKENTNNGFLRTYWVPIVMAIGFGFVLFLGLIFFLGLSNNSKTNKTNTQATSSSQTSKKMEKKNLGYVNSDSGLNLREEASTTGRILQTLPNKTEVTILSEDGDWYLVDVTTRGYLSKQFVSLTKPDSTLKVYAFDSLNFKFIYPESYEVKLTKGQPNTFKFGNIDSSGGFTVDKETSGQTLNGYLAATYPKAKTAACDITIGNAKECMKVTTDEDDFYLVNASSNILKINVLTNYGDFPSDLTAIIFPSFFFLQ